jgi:hypothetical protein
MRISMESGTGGRHCAQTMLLGPRTVAWRVSPRAPAPGKQVAAAAGDVPFERQVALRRAEHLAVQQPKCQSAVLAPAVPQLPAWLPRAARLAAIVAGASALACCLPSVAHAAAAAASGEGGILKSERRHSLSAAVPRASAWSPQLTLAAVTAARPFQA